MAWDHNARNRSAEVRRVNYHENGPGKSSKNSSGSQGNSGNGGGLSPIGKVILGGICLYVMGSLGLGWIEDVKDGFDKAQEIRQVAQETKELEKAKEKDAKKSEKADKKNKKDLNSQGYTEKFDTDEDELGLEAGDVRDIIEEIEEQVNAYKTNEIDNSNIIYLNPEVFDNSSNYKNAILNRLKNMNKTPITFVSIYDNVSDNKANKEYEHMVNICEMNLSEDDGLYNSIDIKAFIGVPEDNSMTIALTYSIKDTE